jgi:hypothetical protein
MQQLKTKFEIRGQLVDIKTNKSMIGFSIITETGIRDTNSFLHTVSVGPVVQSNSEGKFVSTFFTPKSSIPKTIEVHIEFKPGSWRCRVVPMQPQMIKTTQEHYVQIDLDRIEVDYDKCIVPVDN